MGIPGLSKPLKPYAVSTTVGCKTPDCEEHKSAYSDSSRDIIVDGPSFAYSIYHRLIIQKPEWLTAVEAMPSYEEIGQGAIAFLDELEDYGLKIKHIYFDGYLPPHKRDIRLDRLQRSLQKLSSHHAVSQKLQPCKRKWDGKPLPPGAVFPSGSPTQAAFRGLPPATFVVPAVLDALGTSKYAANTAVVPGEAEVYCATAARENGGIVLSNDSDLFVHDLGNGGFVYLDSIELRPNESKDQIRNPRCCKIFRLEVIRPPDIAQRLGVKNLQELAFQFVRRHSYTLSEAIKATRDQRDREEELAYQKFLQEYNTEPSVSENQRFSPQALARLHTQARFLDPRISELICQLESKHTHEAEVYLLPLIEDPTRSSAWSVSSSHRSFIYSVLALYLTRTPNPPPPTTPTKITITEHRRRAHSYTPHPIPLLPPPSLLSFARTLLTHLHLLTNHFPTLPPPLIYRLYALFTIHLHHLNLSKQPPSLPLLHRALAGKYTPHPIWEDIHLLAQIQAVLYALRMIKQVLGYVAEGMLEEEGVGLPRELRELREELRELPGLGGWEVGAWGEGEGVVGVDGVDGVDGEGVLEKLGGLLREEVGGEEGGGEVVGEGFGKEVEDKAAMETGGKKGKRKRKKRKEKTSEVMDKGGQGNMFQMLA